MINEYMRDGWNIMWGVIHHTRVYLHGLSKGANIVKQVRNKLNQYQHQGRAEFVALLNHIRRLMKLHVKHVG